jgi:hypothetical protein
MAPIRRPDPARSSIAWRSAAGLAALALLTGSTVVSCKGDVPPDSTVPSNRPDSQSMGRWTPATNTTRFPRECKQDVHDSYFVIGPDGRKYPTWHPPTHVDASTGEICYFGHEHGDNPSGSALYNDLRRHFAWDANGNGTIEESEWNNATTGIPFGYAAEYGGSPATILHDSYKVALVNGIVRQRLVAGVAEDFGLACNQLLAFAHDTQSTAGFAQAQHPITYAIDCSGSGDSANYVSKLIVSVMADFGVLTADPPRTGEVAAGRRFAETTAQVYPNAYVAVGATSDLVAALQESWDSIVTLRTAGSAELARFNPGFVSRDPARYRNGAAGVQSIDLCYTGLDAGGNLVSDPLQAGSIVRQVRGSATDCARLTPTGPSSPTSQRVRFDDREAVFKGCSRQVVFREQSIRNASGPSTWYTNPAGGEARSVAFAGSLRQFVAIGSSTTTVVLAAATDDASVDCSASTGVHVRVAAQ